MEHVTTVTDTINQTLIEVENKRYGEEVYSVEWFRLTDEIGILRIVRDHLEAKAKIATKYKETLKRLERHQKNCPRCSFIPTWEENYDATVECSIEDDIKFELNELRKQIEKGDL